jgi:hypothetical protein
VEKGNLSIAAVSGTSGGALNGAVCAYGLMDGPKEAKRLLKALWDAVSSKSLWPVDPYRMLLPKDSPERWNVDWSPMAIGLGMAEQICSPYVLPLKTGGGGLSRAISRSPSLVRSSGAAAVSATRPSQRSLAFPIQRLRDFYVFDRNRRVQRVIEFVRL